MIHIVTEDNRRLYGREFETLAELVKDRPAKLDALAGDAFSVHILALDGLGAPEFACRLQPTDKACRIADLAPGLLAAGADSIRRSQTWERRRIYAAPYLSGPEDSRRRRRGALRLAVLEEACERGVDRIVEAAPCSDLIATLCCGWRIGFLGLPGALDGATVIAVEVDASPEAADELRERLAAGPSQRLHLRPGETPWSAAPKEIEAFLEAARQLGSSKLEPLLAALRAAAKDDSED